MRKVVNFVYRCVEERMRPDAQVKFPMSLYVVGRHRNLHCLTSAGFGGKFRECGREPLIPRYS